MSTCIVVPQPNDDLVVEECKVPVVCSSWDQCWSRPACVYGSSKMPARSWQSCTATVSVTLALLWWGLAIMLTITITGRSAAAQNAAPRAAAQMGAAMEYWSVLKGSASWGQLSMLVFAGAVIQAWLLLRSLLNSCRIALNSNMKNINVTSNKRETEIMKSIQSDE